MRLRFLFNLELLLQNEKREKLKFLYLFKCQAGEPCDKKCQPSDY